MIFTAFVLCVLRLFKLKTEGETAYRKPHCKVAKLKSKFSLILGWALNNPVQ